MSMGTCRPALNYYINIIAENSEPNNNIIINKYYDGHNSLGYNIYNYMTYYVHKNNICSHLINKFFVYDPHIIYVN